MKLVVIGSGSGIPVPHKRGSSYWLESENESILLDCGDGCAGGIKSANLEPNMIGTIVITHLHSDHWCGFPFLIQMFHLLKRKRPLRVILPSEGIKLFPKILEMSYMWHERIGFQIIWEQLHHRKNMDLGICEITPFMNSHLNGYEQDKFRHPYSKMECFSLEISCQSKRGVYSSDIGKLSDLEPLFSRQIDWLLIEGMHFKINDFVPWLKEKQIGKTIMTHIPPEREKENFAPDVIIASDGMKFEL